MFIYKEIAFRQKITILVTIFCFLSSSLFPSFAAAQMSSELLSLPPVGSRLTLTSDYSPIIIKGLQIIPDQPLNINFIIDSGSDPLDSETVKAQSNKLIKYFLASLTVPQDRMWVNLSPYEKNRIVPQEFGATEMGRDLLAQDYMLKQLTASLMYPDQDLGVAFWDKVRLQAQEKFGTSDIPVNTFNKIWIVPQRATILIHDNMVFIEECHLKVMMEEDYLALEMNHGCTRHGLGAVDPKALKAGDDISTPIVREILIPQIEKEVNEGRTFANLRQIFHSMILANWYKNNLQKSLLGSIYADQNKIEGLENQDPSVNQKIYEQYVAAFEKGVFSFIKEEYDAQTQQVIPRKYFSGGVDSAMLGSVVQVKPQDKQRRGIKNLFSAFSGDVLLTAVSLNAANVGVAQEFNFDQEIDPAMISSFKQKLKIGLFSLLFSAVSLSMNVGDASASKFFINKSSGGVSQLFATLEEGDTSSGIVKKIAKQLKIKLTDLEIEQIIDEANGKKGLILEGAITEGAEVDLVGVNNAIFNIGLINRSNFLKIQRINVNGQDTFLHFLDVDQDQSLGEFVELTSDTNIFINLNAIYRYLNTVRLNHELFKKDLSSKKVSGFYSRLLDGKSNRRLFNEFIEEMVFHAYAHTITTPDIINGIEKPFLTQAVASLNLPDYMDGKSYSVKQEMSGMLGQLIGSGSSMYTLKLFTQWSTNKPELFPLGPQYVFASRIFIKQIFNLLGYRDFLLKRAVDAERENMSFSTVEAAIITQSAINQAYDAGEFFTKDALPDMNDFVELLTDDAIVLVASKLHEDYFTALPDTSVIKIPKEVLDYAQEKYLDVLEGKASAQGDVSSMDKDNSMINTDTKGGIDLNPAAMHMEVDGAMEDFQVPVSDLEQWQGREFNGLVPVMINITPINNIPLFLGLNEADDYKLSAIAN